MKLILVSAFTISGRPEEILFNHLKSTYKPDVAIKYGGDSGMLKVYSNMTMEKYYSYVINKLLDSKIENNDIIIWCDGLIPPVSTIRHFIEAEHLIVRMIGYWHQVPSLEYSYLNHSKDFAVSWSKHIYDCLDTVLVGSNYASNAIKQELGDNSKVIPVGFPSVLPLYYGDNGIPEVVYFNRPTESKGIYLFVKWCKTNNVKGHLITNFKSVKIEGISNNVFDTKEECLEFARKFKYFWAMPLVSETFSWSTYELYRNGLIPILNSHGSYAEFYPDYVDRYDWRSLEYKEQPIVKFVGEFDEKIYKLLWDTNFKCW